MVLKDGRVMAPAFQVGKLVCHDVTTTSVRVAWPKPTDKKYPVHSYRVCTAEVGSGFEVTRFEALAWCSSGHHGTQTEQWLRGARGQRRLA